MDKYKLWFASIKLSNHIKIKLLEELENEKIYMIMHFL